MQRVLVIDDETAVRNLICRIVKSAGLEVLPAETAEQGLHIMESHGTTVSLIILDLITPGMTGYQALPLFRARFPNTNILISSGAMEDYKLVDYLIPGKVEQIAKPYGIADLRTAIERLSCTTGE